MKKSYRWDVWSRTAPFAADPIRKSQTQFQRTVRRLRIKQLFRIQAVFYIEWEKCRDGGSYLKRRLYCYGWDRRDWDLCRNILWAPRLRLPGKFKCTDISIQLFTESNGIVSKMTYVATVSTTKRIVSVRSADEHLVVVDPCQDSNIILTVILFIFSKNNSKIKYTLRMDGKDALR